MTGATKLANVSRKRKEVTEDGGDGESYMVEKSNEKLILKIAKRKKKNTTTEIDNTRPSKLNESTTTNVSDDEGEINTSIIIINNPSLTDQPAGDDDDVGLSQPIASSTPDKKTRHLSTSTDASLDDHSSQVIPATDDTFADLTPLPPFNSLEPPFNTQDFLNVMDSGPTQNTDTGVNTAATDEQIRDFELDCSTLPDLVGGNAEGKADEIVRNVEEAYYYSRQDQKGLLDARIDFSNETQNDLQDERQAPIVLAGNEHNTTPSTQVVGGSTGDDDHPSILYKTQNAFRELMWKGSNNQKILSNKYVIPTEKAGEKIVACYTVDEKCLSFTTKVIAKGHVALRVNVSVGSFQSAAKGQAKAIHVPVEELSDYCKQLNEILETRTSHPRQIIKRRFTINSNEIINMESNSSDSELVIKHIVPDDIKKLSHDIASRNVNRYYEARKDATVCITQSEVRSFVNSMNLACEFVTFLKTCEAMKLATYYAVTQRFFRTPERFHPRIYYENIVSEFHNLKIDSKYKWPIGIVMSQFVHTFANEKYSQDFTITD